MKNRLFSSNLSKIAPLFVLLFSFSIHQKNEEIEPILYAIPGSPCIDVWRSFDNFSSFNMVYDKVCIHKNKICVYAYFYPEDVMEAGFCINFPRKE